MIGEEFLFPQSLSPIRTEKTMGGTGNGVLVDIDPRSEEAGDKVIGGGFGAAGDDDSAGLDLPEFGKVRVQVSNDILRINLHKIIKPVFADILT